MGAYQDQLRGFAKYNLEFNRNLFDRLAGLDDEQRKRDMGAFFGSIHATLNHILLADRIWLGRFATGFPAMTSLAGAAVLHAFPSLRHELHADFDELHAQRGATDAVIVRWAAELTDELLSSTLRYRTSNGQQRAHPAWIAAAHLFNHQTHHRGQVTTLMHQQGVDPGVTDYLVYVQ